MVISEQKYIEYYESIINNDSFSDQKKCGLLSILMMYNSVYDDEYLNGLEELEYDNGIYILADEERINLEIENLFGCLNENENEVLLNELYSISSDFMNGEDLNNIKKRITLLQLELKLEPKFISVFRSILNDLEINVKEKTFVR